MAALAAPTVPDQGAALIVVSTFGIVFPVLDATMLPAPEISSGGGGDDDAVGYAS